MLRQKSSSSVTITSIDQNEVMVALSDIAKRLRADHDDVASVRVFGSIARGDHVGTSDIDVLIVLRSDGEIDHLTQIRRFYPYFDLPIGVDLLVYGQDEVDRRLTAGDAFMTRIWGESQPLAPSHHQDGQTTAQSAPPSAG